MFKVIKWIIWLVVVFFVARYIMGFFGYEINSEYFKYSQKQCEGNLKTCVTTFASSGSADSICNFKCVNPKLIIKKKQ
jgi:hypothetical protein